MNAVQQFYQMVAERYYEIERLKAEARERGEFIFNVTKALISNEISYQQYRELIGW